MNPRLRFSKERGLTLLSSNSHKTSRARIIHYPFVIFLNHGALPVFNGIDVFGLSFLWAFTAIPFSLRVKRVGTGYQSVGGFTNLNNAVQSIESEGVSGFSFNSIKIRI